MWPYHSTYQQVGRVMSWTQTCFGLGYMLGPGVGAWFYEMGGFMLPFLVVGSLSTILSLLLIITIPNVSSEESEVQVDGMESSDDEGQTLITASDPESNCIGGYQATVEGDGESLSDNEASINEDGNGPMDGDTPNNNANGTHANGTANGSAVKGAQVQLRFRTILKSPPLMLPFVDLFSALCGNGMLESMLEPHLKAVGATTIDVGVTFLIFGLCYMIGNMFFGTAIDKVGRPVLFSLLGNTLFLITFIFVGPLDFVPIATTKELVRGMMALAGVAYAALVVSSFSRAQCKVLEMGFDDGINTSTMISGIWLSAFSLGNFVGPTIAGALVQTEGFKRTTLMFFALYAIMMLVDIVDIILTKLKQKRRNRYDHI